MDRVRGLLVILALLLAPAAAGAQSPDPPGHDPTLIRQGDWWYTITTSEGDLARRYLPVQRTRDLVHWEPAGVVFGVPPAWIVQQIGTLPTDLWAPDLSFFGGRYHVYYAASHTGVNNSAIGLATSATLDPQDPAYGWRDEGMVVRSTPGVDDFNAIDPEVVLDEAGRPWLAYGSYWTGIKLVALDPATGRPTGPVHAIASRPAPSAIEAPTIVRRDGWYYLFVSFDHCCRGVASDYRVVVGRSQSITGPYLDRAGVPMAAGGGSDLLRGYGRFAGPGHQDVLLDERGDLLIHHYYDRDEGGRARLSVRDVAWVDGWPVVGAPVSELQPLGRQPVAAPQVAPPFTAPFGTPVPPG